MSSVNGVGELTGCTLVRLESLSRGRHRYSTSVTGKMNSPPCDFNRDAGTRTWRHTRSSDDDTDGPCMRVETLTGSGPLRARTNGLPLEKGQCFWAIYWQIAMRASVLCGVQLSTSRAKMSVSLHILRQTGKVPWPSALHRQEKGRIKCLYEQEYGVRGLALNGAALASSLY